MKSMMLQIMEKRCQMMTTWEQGASADAAAHRINDAGIENANFREMMVKENERNKENEAEFLHAEEPKGDRRIAFPSHTWEPREETGTTPYQDMVKPEVLTRDAIVWSRITMQWKETVNEEDETRLGGKNTLWLYLAFDFRAATFEKVSKMVRPQGEALTSTDINDSTECVNTATMHITT